VISDIRNAVCVHALILFLANLLRKRVCIDSRNVNKILYCYHTSGAKFVASRLCLVTETAYYVHIVLALRLTGITVGFYLRIFAFYLQCLTVGGVSQPSFKVARKIRISQGPQSYYVLGNPGKSGEPKHS